MWSPPSMNVTGATVKLSIAARSRAKTPSPTACGPTYGLRSASGLPSASFHLVAESSRGRGRLAQRFTEQRPQLANRYNLSGGIGWEAGIRTAIPWSRATCPTVGRPPSAGRTRSRARTPDYNRLESSAAKRARPHRRSLSRRLVRPARRSAVVRILPADALAALLLLLPAMTRHAALAPRLTRFLARPLVSGAFLMRRFATLAGNLALLRSIHRRKSAIFFCHAPSCS